MKEIADISKWQGDVNWAKAATELELAILRASCGEGMDTKYLRNAEGCAQNNIPFGAYHYVKAGTAAQARKEAQFFVSCTKKAARQPSFFIADIEYEAQTKDATEAVCVAFLEELRAQGCGKIGLYINPRYKWAGAAIGMCDVMWIPHWGKNDGNVPEDKYKSSNPHDLWQYISKGTLAGVKGDVDLNLLMGSKPLEWFTETGTDEKKEDDKMGYDPQKVIDAVRTEVGYLEKASARDIDDKTANAGSNNYTKYARDMDAIPGFYNGRKQGRGMVRRVCGLVFRTGIRRGRGTGAAVPAAEKLRRGVQVFPKLLQGQGTAFLRAAAGRPDFLLSGKRNRWQRHCAYGTGLQSGRYLCVHR